ncbi:MAG: aminodeoxychorismate/anthranilate synthase component II [Deltaproteobacteria bacterium]|nr:aminodeoxychorismate/anthranilate synthase component II [Deltaproteobacteria bacterium]
MILVIDNYDSFTYNLVQMLESSVAGRKQGIEVLRNDAATVDEVLGLKPAGILLSPGPGRPESAGICVDLLRRCAAVPILGVCLGHQALGAAFGARIQAASRLMHGKTSKLRHLGKGPFEDLPLPFEATRYHSLVVAEESLPEDLEALAWSEGGTLMGMRHRKYPYWGVQFHPESILTLEGPRLMSNFLRLCSAGPSRIAPASSQGEASRAGNGASKGASGEAHQQAHQQEGA